MSSWIIKGLDGTRADVMAATEWKFVTSYKSCFFNFDDSLQSGSLFNLLMEIEDLFEKRDDIDLEGLESF